jgi:DNA-directed RNA polymerase subunit RPC12/RpoP
MSDNLICDRCAGAMIFDGRISLPPQTIYKCSNCGNQKWSAEAPPPYQSRPTKPVEQPQAQQQQQPQPTKDPEGEEPA